MQGPYCVSPLISGGHLSHFHVGALVKNIAVNIQAASVLNIGSSSFGANLGVGFPDSKVIFCVTF